MQREAQIWCFLLYIDFWGLPLAYGIPYVPEHCYGGNLVETGQYDVGKQDTS